MTPLQIAILILENAPSILKTAEEIFAWGMETYKKLQAAWDQPAESITREQLLKQLDEIKATSDQIQKL